MKKLFLICILYSSIFWAQETISDFIHVDQFGYTTNSSKVAVLSNPETGYNNALNYTPSATLELRDATNDNLVFSGSPVIWNNGTTHDQSGDKGWWFDFSSVTTEGEYYIIDVANNQKTGKFLISDNVYAAIIKAAGRMYYYNRANTAKPAVYAGQWSDEESFQNPLQDLNCRFIDDPENAALEKELSGGWFDAGDLNKYVSFTNTPIHDLLAAYEEHPDAFADDWNIPESKNSIPDVIDEIKWELDWLQKMMNPDGSVHIKLSSRSFNDNMLTPPSANMDRRFYGPTCSSASIIVASVFAHAAKVFANFPALDSYANELESKAITCFNYAKTYVDNDSYELNCDDGSLVGGDADLNKENQLANFIAAAVYLYELTGDGVYDTYIINQIDNMPQIKTGFWGPYLMPSNDALILYSQLSTADNTTKNKITTSFGTDISNNYNDYYGFSDTDLYRAYIPTWAYTWGSNNTKASFGNVNRLAINSGTQTNTSLLEKYIDETLHYFHGVNPQNIVYLSNMYSYGAEKSVNEIYHQWYRDGSVYDNAIDSPIGPAPGYMTGGANASFTGKDAMGNTLVPPSGQPAQKSFLDFNKGFPESSWEVTEPGIYYQASYIRLLANVTTLQVDDITLSDNKEALALQSFISPNPTSKNIYLNIKAHITSIVIHNSMGTVVFNSKASKKTIGVSKFPQGVYFINVNNTYHQKFIKK